MDPDELKPLLLLLKELGVHKYSFSNGSVTCNFEFEAPPIVLTEANLSGKAEPEDEQDDDSPPTNMSELAKWGLPKPVDPTVAKPEVKKAQGG